MILNVPDGNVVNTDVLLGHAEQEVRKLDIQEERKVLYLPAHVEEVQQAGLHTWQGWEQGSEGQRWGSDDITAHTLTKH